LNQQPEQHNGRWWSRDPSSGVIHYYDEPEGAWKRWDSSSPESPPPDWGSMAPAYPNPPGPYGGYGQPVYVQTSTNGMAIASLVLGILWLWWVGSILALVFGYVGKNQIDKSGGRESGRGMAIAGIVLGWIGVGLLLVFIVLVAVGVSQSGSEFGN
jgi:hypothetical protein